MFSLRLPVLSDGAPVGKLYLSMNSHATEDAIFRSLLFLSLRKILDENTPQPAAGKKNLFSSRNFSIKLDEIFRYYLR